MFNIYFIKCSSKNYTYKKAPSIVIESNDEYNKQKEKNIDTNINYLTHTTKNVDTFKEGKNINLPSLFQSNCINDSKIHFNV